MENKGIALGLWQDVPLWIIIVAILIVVVIAAKTRQLLARTGLVLIIIGGAGNLWQRYTYGWVIDNLNILGVIYNNAWDYLIVIGIVIYGYSYFRELRKLRGSDDR